MCKLFNWVVALLILLAMGCKKSPKSPESMPPMKVETALAQLDSLAQEREFVGYLQSNFSATIQPRVNAFLQKKHYQNGMPVKRGQLLFTLDGSELRTARLRAVAALESARAQLLEAQSNYERSTPLVELEAISRTQYEQYLTQYAAARATLQSAEQALRDAELQEGYTLIYSPINGIIASTSAHEGDYVGPGTQFEVLTTISNLDTLSVDLALPMREYLALGGRTPEQNEGFVRSIRLYLSDGELYPWAGSYGYTHKDVASSEGTLLLSVNFPNPERMLKAGQFARVKASLGAPSGVVRIPSQALVQNQGQNSLWVVNSEGVVSYRAVDVASLEGAWCRISSGLQAGERVLLTGLQKVHNGSKVTF